MMARHGSDASPIVYKSITVRMNRMAKHSTSYDNTNKQPRSTTMERKQPDAAASPESGQQERERDNKGVESQDIEDEQGDQQDLFPSLKDQCRPHAKERADRASRSSRSHRPQEAKEEVPSDINDVFRTQLREQELTTDSHPASSREDHQPPVSRQPGAERLYPPHLRTRDEITLEDDEAPSPSFDPESNIQDEESGPRDRIGGVPLISARLVEDMSQPEPQSMAVAEIVGPDRSKRRLLMMCGAILAVVIAAAAVTAVILAKSSSPTTPTTEPTQPPAEGPLESLNWTWQQIGQTLEGNKIEGFHYFGYSVDINPNGTVLAVGCDPKYGNNSWVEVYELDEVNGDFSWELLGNKISYPEGEPAKKPADAVFLNEDGTRLIVFFKKRLPGYRHCAST